MSIGETAANGVNHTPSGTDSGEGNISEVLANVTPSDTREGFIAPHRKHRQEKAIRSRLARHQILMAAFEAHGFSREDASKAALAQMKAEDKYPNECGVTP